MAIKLEKIYQDCQHSDPQIQTYALMSITRLSPQLVDAPEQIRQIVDRLKVLVNSPNPDVVFLARKAINHLEVQFKAYLGKPGQPVPQAGAHPPPLAPPSSPHAAPVPVRVVPPPPPPPAGARPPSADPLDQPVPRAEPATSLAATPVPVARPVAPSPPPAPPPPPAEPQPPPQPRPARELSRDQIVPLLATTTDHVYLASLVIALVAKGKAEDLDMLRPLLTHPDDRVRSNSVEVFQAHGAPEHVGLLLPLLEDRSNRVVGNACMALARLDHAAVPKKLLWMLRNSLISMRETAAYVLSTLDKEYVEPLLVLAAADPYEGVRLRSVKSLGRFATRESVNALKNALNDMDINICEAASESLKQIKAALQARREQAEAAARAQAEAEVRAQAEAAARARSEALALAQSEAHARAAAEAARLAAEEQARAAAGPAIEPSPRAPKEPDLPTPEEITPEPPVSIADQPATPAPAEGSPEAVRVAERDAVLKEIGTLVYQLCRSNLVTNELLDGIFYEILRYQDFLRAYQTKAAQGGDESVRAAIGKLEEKVRGSLSNLGRQAAQLFKDGTIQLVQLPEKEKVAIQELLIRFRKVKRTTLT
ncbi:MAG: HEAT repeat domain-containing protein [Candidatus Riflebacteria bacterium]|nr:HEAT repeat domain-containing protein [Candidatus Riflebacteria bacterium]